MRVNVTMSLDVEWVAGLDTIRGSTPRSRYIEERIGNLALPGDPPRQKPPTDAELRDGERLAFDEGREEGGS